MKKKKKLVHSLEVFEKLKSYMKPGYAYRSQYLARQMGMNVPALRRYLRRLVSVGLLKELKHPKYPKRKFYTVATTSPTSIVVPSSAVTEKQNIGGVNE